MSEQCPRCGSDKPHLHPAVQNGGEVELCTDVFHLRQTPQNRPGYIAAVRARLRAKEPVDADADVQDGAR
jgi:hypothetical protein